MIYGATRRLDNASDADNVNTVGRWRSRGQAGSPREGQPEIDDAIIQRPARKPQPASILYRPLDTYIVQTQGSHPMTASPAPVTPPTWTSLHTSVEYPAGTSLL